MGWPRNPAHHRDPHTVPRHPGAEPPPPEARFLPRFVQLALPRGAQSCVDTLTAPRNPTIFPPTRPRTLVDPGTRWDTAGPRIDRGEREYQQARGPEMQV